ncbi:hypothetical protein Pcinc_007770 [Petrolisthes cinctipes]|uniref:Uncharacterized protein n=1 Tax=Petrolisthes cinctipes TaxID=88211 RepID=A0AAE1GAB0_PETCI|nr:hypothetical protein Pcinc_007770 [Petrolisthes cinctipes]
MLCAAYGYKEREKEKSDPSIIFHKCGNRAFAANHTQPPRGYLHPMMMAKGSPHPHNKRDLHFASKG